MEDKEFHDFLDVCLCSHGIEKANKPAWLTLSERFERVVAARMLKGYTRSAKKAIKRAGNLVLKGESVPLIVDTVDRHMEAMFTRNEVARIAKDITRYYKADKNLAANEFKIDNSDIPDQVTLKSQNVYKADDPDIKFEAAFDLDDQRVLQSILAQNMIAAQNIYTVGFSKTVSEVIAAIVRETGLSQADQKKLLIPELEKALGLKPGDLVTQNVKPPRFRGSAKDYFTGLSQTTLTRARVSDRMILFSQGEIERFEFVAGGLLLLVASYSTSSKEIHSY